MRHSYAKRQELQLLLYPMLTSMADIYRRIGLYEASIRCFEEAFEAVDNPLKFVYGVSLFIHMVEDCLRLGQRDRARNYALRAFELEKIRIGLDENGFKLLYPEFNTVLS